MYLIIIGKIDAGSSRIEFRLPEKIWPSSVTNLDSVRFAGSGIQIQLVNFSYCDDANHADTHFPAPTSLFFPSAPENYQPTIRVRIPRPFRLSHRRSTIYFVPNLDLTTDTGSYEDRANDGQYLPQPPLRLRRSTVPLIDDGYRSRVRRTPVLTDREIKYYAGFDRPFAMSSFVRPGPTTARDFMAKIKSYQEIRINAAFGFLNAGNLSFAYERTLATPEHVSLAAPDSHTKIEKLKIRVTVPPMLHVGFSDSRLWQALGFDLTEFSIKAFKHPEGALQFFGPSNTTSTPITLTASHWIVANASLFSLLRLLALQRGPQAPFQDSISLGAIRAPSKTEGSTFVPSDACISDSSYALTVYQTILRNIGQELTLRTNALVAEENKAEGTITLKQFVEPTSPTFTSNNFKLLISAGSAAGSALGISERNPCLWFPVEGNWKSETVTTTSNVCDDGASADDLSYQHSNQAAAVTPDNLSASSNPGTPPLTSTPIPSPPPIDTASVPSVPAPPPIDTASLPSVPAPPPIDTASLPAPPPETKRKADSTHPEAPPKKKPHLGNDDTEESGTTDVGTDTENSTVNESHATEIDREKQEALEELEITKRRQEESARILEEEQRARDLEEQKQAEEKKQIALLEAERQNAQSQLDTLKKQQAELSEALELLKHKTQTDRQQHLELKQKQEAELVLIDQKKQEKEAALLKLEEEAKRNAEERERLRLSEAAQEQQKLHEVLEKRRSIEQDLQTALQQLRDTQVERLRVLEESRALTDSAERRKEETELAQLRELQKQKQEQLDHLENRKRKLEQDHRDLMDRAQKHLTDETQKVLDAARQRAEVETQKILEQAKKQAAEEREKARLDAEAKRQELEQERLFREQEGLRLGELQTKLHIEREHLASERKKIDEASMRLSALEKKLMEKAKEAAELTEQKQKSDSEASTAKIDSEMANINLQKTQLQNQTDALKNEITKATEMLQESESVARNLEDQASRIQDSLAEQTESIMDVDPSDPPLSPAQTFQTPDGSPVGSDDENRDPQPPSPDPSELWDYVDIPNPDRPPLATFEPAQTQPLGRCPMPPNFPQTFSLILLEGVNRDYCMERGFCSILGTVITSPNGHKQIIDNFCILQANEVERFTIDIVDEHLNAFCPTRTAFVKLDLKLQRLVKSLY